MNEDVIRGVFTYCIYKSGSYAVWRFMGEDETIIVTGDLALIDMNKTYLLYGEYFDHPKYGIQFKVSYFTQELPSDLKGVIAYLSSDLFYGIGEKKARKITEALGSNALSLIRDDPSVLDAISISDKDKNVIIGGLSSNVGYEESLYYLLSNDIDIKDINKLLAFYKENTKSILQDDPYRPYFEVYGIGFATCDEIALKLGIKKDDPKRKAALVHHLISEYCFQSGDTYIDHDTIRKLIVKFDRELDENECLNAALLARCVIYDGDHYYTYGSYQDEESIAKYLVFHNIADETVKDEVLTQKLESLAKDESIIYDEKQIAAIFNFFHNKLSLIIGGPGTGKTTVIKAIAKVVKEIDPISSFHVVAPTGRAAKRIRELCGVESSTIHSLLKWDKETNTFTHCSANPLAVDYLIIDEFSMVDNWLFHKLIDALGNVKKLCMIGDDNQLPSVGSGDLLHDLIVTDLFSTTRLKTIFRQKEGSDIIDLCNQVLDGNIDLKRRSKDYFFLFDDLNWREDLIAVIKDYLDEGFDINDIQLLSPMYKGALGIESLNLLMQSVFNPDIKESLKSRYRLFKVGDKVIQLKNQSQEDVFNGDIGTIEEIESNEGTKRLIARFDDIFIEYKDDFLSNIALAYCISVHKAQGSEYPIVIFAFSKAHIHMLNKNLIYTALSRAGNKLIIIGEKDIFLKGAKKHMAKRKTTLVKRLLEYNE